MFRRNIKNIFRLALATLLFSVNYSYAADATTAPVANVNTANLPINNATANNTVSEAKSNALVSPSAAKAVTTEKKEAEVANPAQEASKKEATKPAQEATKQKASATDKSDFDFDLKMKSLSSSTQPSAPSSNPQAKADNSSVDNVELPKDIQYKANPVDTLGNSVLSQMDSDLFSQMSEIEKSTTLLTLELKREKIRNEIEAQRAIRLKNKVDLERQKEESRLKGLEREKQIEAQVLLEKQNLVDKEKMFEVLKQRKLLNAYMNQMLVNQQEWLKEKETLYAKIEVMEMEKKELIAMFKQRIDKILEASAKNIQVAEAAKANFERIVKNLKARNEQLRKRVEADAQIIKNAKNSMYLKSQSIEELKDRNLSASVVAANAANLKSVSTPILDDEVEVKVSKLSSQYAILGISGRAGNMSVDLIDAEGQPISLKVGSPLPTGHVVSEIGADYTKFSRDGEDDYLYVGRSIDGVVPNLNGNTASKK